jgi:hypothetical protein
VATVTEAKGLSHVTNLTSQLWFPRSDGVPSTPAADEVAGSFKLRCNTLWNVWEKSAAPRVLLYNTTTDAYCLHHPQSSAEVEAYRSRIGCGDGRLAGRALFAGTDTCRSLA